MSLTITIPGGTIQLAGTRVKVNINTDTVQGSLYRILLKVSNADGKLDGMPQVSEGTPDDNGDAEFDISGLLFRRFVPSFSENGGDITEHDDIPCKVQLDIGESYIDDNSIRQENWAGLTGDQYTITALQGGLSGNEQNGYNEMGSSWYASFVQSGKWLTSLISGLKVSPNSAATLWYITPETEAQNIMLKADYVLNDGTTGTIERITTINPGSLYEFPVDAPSLGLTVTGDNTVQKYECYLEKDDVQITEKFTFNIDYNFYEFNTQVFAKNKYGGVDPYWFTGKVSHNFPAEHNTAQRTAKSTDTRKNRTQIATSKTGSRVWKVNTGHKSFAEIIALSNLLLSQQLWLVHNGEIVPVNIESSDEELGTEQDNKHSFIIEFTEAHKNKF